LKFSSIKARDNPKLVYPTSMESIIIRGVSFLPFKHHVNVMYLDTHINHQQD
jgi:hypothetical protein